MGAGGYAESSWNGNCDRRDGLTERKFTSIESAIEKIAAGGMVIVVDDETLENEGDFIMAAEKVTPEYYPRPGAPHAGWHPLRCVR